MAEIQLGQATFHDSKAILTDYQIKWVTAVLRLKCLKAGRGCEIDSSSKTLNMDAGICVINISTSGLRSLLPQDVTKSRRWTRWPRIHSIDRWNFESILWRFKWKATIKRLDVRLSRDLNWLSRISDLFLARETCTPYWLSIISQICNFIRGLTSYRRAGNRQSVFLVKFSDVVNGRSNWRGTQE